MSDKSATTIPIEDVSSLPHPLAKNSEQNRTGPQRFIYTQSDMEHFRQSSARKELLSFVTAMGRGLTTSNLQEDNPHSYVPNQTLHHLTPALASLHGSLTCMAETWINGDHPDGIPPDMTTKARFGNPAFRTWHARLIQRSYAIVKSCLDCHLSCGTKGDDQLDVLLKCSKKGYEVASNTSPEYIQSTSKSNEEEIIEELRAYLHDAFGHPIRIDYGTGHESSFVVFLLALCKIGCFVWGFDVKNKMPDASSSDEHFCSNISSDRQIHSTPSPSAISRASLSLLHAYLNVTRGLQRDYMLEPAGSHGVWGLDDYHCIPFYVGSCQLVAREQWQQHQLKEKTPSDRTMTTDSKVGKQESDGDIAPTNQYIPEKVLPDPKVTSLSKSSHDDNMEHWDPSIIRNRQALEAHRQTYLYFGCIHFIQQIKPNVPFFESSPMLNDISSLGNWTKVSSGLLRLYEGEVLDKLPVVQHFVFGKIFSANWTPSKKGPLEAPKWTFAKGPMGGEYNESLVSGGKNSEGVGGLRIQSSSGGNPSHPGGMAPTRAPWAK